ncbi:MAG: large subunit ribosomal protein [Patescibacteria group bacterium]|nr:large subunit ribosomal protein [Patescibacteria group bacterium]
MKVIFLHDVPRVGKKNDIKEVNDGYALNFLIPRKLVDRATEKSVQNLELRKKEIVETMSKEHKAQLSEEFIVLDKPIKELGEFDIPVEIKGKKSSFKLIIKSK